MPKLPMLRWTFVLMLMLSMSACGQSYNNADPEAAIAALARFRSELARAQCAPGSYNARCRGYQGANTEECETYEWLLSEYIVEPAYREALGNGTVTFDAAAGAECIRSVAALACIEPWPGEIPSRCAGVFRGNVAANEPCRHWFECGGGNRCLHTSPCTGVCGRARAVGESCATLEECETGAICRGGTCRAFATRTDVCSSNRPCEMPAVCFASQCIGKDEVPLPDVGAPCARVEAAGVPLEWCARDAYCDDNSTCRALVPLGQECTANKQCGIGARCSNRVCRAEARIGEACDANRDCHSIAFRSSICADGVCVATRANGQRCSTPTECASVHCVNGICADLILCL